MDGKKKLDYEAFAQEWNKSANGKECYYVTTEVLTAYAKTWEKISNIRASREMISDRIENINQSRNIFAAAHLPFPNFLTGSVASMEPQQGVLNMCSQSLPLFLLTYQCLMVSHHLHYNLGNQQIFSILCLICK